MYRCSRLLARVVAVAVVSSVGVFAAQAFAKQQEETSIVVEQPAAATPPETAAEPLPGLKTAQPAVRSAPPTIYRASRSARRMLRCQQQVELVMVTKNPADCCLYEVCLCLPACCTGEPIVKERRGIRGRGVVEYCWECGFTATVKFRHRIGDVKVEYDA